MGFYATSFSYDNVPSETYNLSIASIDDSGGVVGNGSGDVTIIEQFVFGRTVPYFFGVQYDNKLTFPVSFYSQTEITALDASLIQYWLFGNQQYKKLSIIQQDMDQVYFNCIFTEPETIRFGNKIYGFSANCVCDSPFAWQYPKTVEYLFAGMFTNDTVTFYNDNHYKGYLYPELTIYMPPKGRTFQIVNASDNDRMFEFEDLTGGDVIHVNNDLCILTANSGDLLLPKFNKNFFRLVPGLNTLHVYGHIDKLNITYQYARRLGG